MAVKDAIGELPYNSEGVFTVFLRYKGVWDMEELYVRMVDFIRKRKFHFHEKAYKHKHPSPFGVERQYVWEAIRKESDFMEFRVNIYFHTYDAHEVDVILPDGAKKVYTKGRLWMEFRGSIEFDWDKHFQKKAFYMQLRNFYNKYIIKKRREQQWWDKLWYHEVLPLRQLVMDILKMQEDKYEHRHWQGPHMGV